MKSRSNMTLRKSLEINRVNELYGARIDPV